MDKLQDIFDKKQSFIDSKLADTTSKIVIAERSLLDTMISEIADQLDIDSKKIIQNTPKNIRLLNRIDKIYSDFTLIFEKNVMSGFAQGLLDITKFNQEYFAQMGFKKSTLDKIFSQTKSIQESIGITSKAGKAVITPNGYLDGVTKSPEIANKIKKYTLDNLNNKTDWGDFKKGMKDIITNTEGAGILQRQIENYAFDTYNVADRAENVYASTQLNLRAFVYAGGRKIKGTRPFCGGGYDKICGCKFESKINKVFIKDEFIKEFGEVEFQGKMPGDIMNTLGGYLCRHQPRFISDEEAIRRDPTLEAKLKKK